MDHKWLLYWKINEKDTLEWEEIVKNKLSPLYIGYYSKCRESAPGGTDSLILEKTYQY